MFFSKEATFNTFFENSIYEIVEREKTLEREKEKKKRENVFGISRKM